MVVDVFVHPHGPLVGSEPAEKAVGMIGATCGTGGGEAIDGTAELLAFVGEVAVVGDLEAGNGGRVATHWFALLECFGFDQASDEAANEHARRTAVAASELHADGAVGHGLCWSHFAPEARSVRAETGDAVFEFLDAVRLPEILHGGVSLEEMIADAGASPVSRQLIACSPFPCIPSVTANAAVRVDTRCL